MKLEGINVVVDGYNLGLAEGTGIKTYSLTLIKALQLLGADVGLLYGNPRLEAANPTLNEVLFFDIHGKGPRQLKLVKELCKILLRFPSKARQITAPGTEVVIRGEWVKAYPYQTRIFNVPYLYEASFFSYGLLGVGPEVRLPNRVDVWHRTHPTAVKINGAGNITTIHDLIPLLLPYTTLDNKRWTYRIVRDTIRNSQLIITVSENSKKDILNLFDCKEEKIHVTYQPVLQPETAVTSDEMARRLWKYELYPKLYILYVGAIEAKKNLGRLIQAYAAIDTDIPLVIVGKKAWLWPKEIDDLERALGRRVRLLDYIQRDELKYLYAGACFFVFPSLYEGFGLPPLEAMTHGCPVIVSNTSSLPEVCGDAAIYVDPYDVTDIRRKIEDLINDSNKREVLSKLGKKQAEKFAMAGYLDRVLAAYKKVLG